MSWKQYWVRCLAVLVGAILGNALLDWMFHFRNGSWQDQVIFFGLYFAGVYFFVLRHILRKTRKG